MRQSIIILCEQYFIYMWLESLYPIVCLCRLIIPNCMLM